MFLIDTSSSITCVLRKEKALQLAMIAISLQMHYNIVRNQWALLGDKQRGTLKGALLGDKLPNEIK